MPSLPQSEREAGGLVQAVTALRAAVVAAAVLAAPTTAASHGCDLYEYRAVITEVYDGDTVTTDVDLGFRVWLRGEKLRLSGINTPELRGVERPQGLVARDRLRERIQGKEVRICTDRDRTGKYGRYLATIWLDGEDINAWLLSEGLAEEYR